MTTSAPLATSLKVEHLGLVDYQSTWELQRQIQSGVIEGKVPNTLLLLEHNSVYTAGRRTQAHERPLDGTPVIDTDRGGKITWHGPGQLIGYPIIKLRNRNDVVGFVREIETSLIAALAEFGIEPRHLRQFKIAADREVSLVEQVTIPIKNSRENSAEQIAQEKAREIAALCTALHVALVRAGIGKLL